MIRCNKCGADAHDDANFCTSCGAPIAQQTTTYSFYEKFDVKQPNSKTVLKYIFTDKSVIFGNEQEYKYEDMTEQFKATRKPGTYVNGIGYVNGIFETSINGKSIQIQYNYHEIERFTKAIEYANEIIFKNLNVSNAPSAKSDGGNLDLPSAEVEYQTPIDQIGSIELPEWKPISGTQVVLTLCGKPITISPELDAYNKYRKRFEEYASRCLNGTISEYNSNISDLVSFLENFPDIYDKYLGLIVDRVIDACVIEGIWTCTKEDVFNTYKREVHSAMDIYDAITQMTQNTLENNQNTTAGIMSLVPNLSGGGFGLRGALKGIAKAAAFNAVRDTIESTAIRRTNISPAQQADIFGRIDPQDLQKRIYIDYSLAHLILVTILRKTGKQIWLPDQKTKSQMINAFKNISNPNFPQDKIPDVMIAIILSDPYNVEYYRFLISKFGENEEVKNIIEYFGYSSKI